MHKLKEIRPKAVAMLPKHTNSTVMHSQLVTDLKQLLVSSEVCIIKMVHTQSVHLAILKCTHVIDPKESDS